MCEPAWTRELRRLGLRVLANEHVVVARGEAALVLAGVTDYGAHHFDPQQRSDPAAAVRAFRAVLALQPVDRAAAHADLAESYLRNGQRAEARRQTLAALEIAPSYRRAQDLLLELAGDRP